MLTPLAERRVPTFTPDVHFLGGRRVEGEGAGFEVLFPATGETLVRLKAASPEQIEAAVAQARATFDAGGWRSTPAAERARVLDAAADALARRVPELRDRIICDNGKTLAEAANDVYAAVGGLRFAARLATTEAPACPAPDGGLVKLLLREPVGVVAAVIPFNAPLPFAVVKCAPALAAGNSVVLKPSERAPLVCVALCEALAEAGLPPGVASLLHGAGDVSARLVADPRVDMITFTGGTSAGTAMMQAAAPGIKRVLLELGGKSAHIVLADADLDTAVQAVAAGIFRNSGQRCFSGSRLVVEESVADRVVEGVAALAEGLVVGDPFDPSSEVGCMIDERAVSEAERFVAGALGEGLGVAAGGRRVEELRPGAFFRPTVLTGASRDSRAAQDELFGPVVTVIRVRDADEAVAVANHSRYGLAGGVWSRDLSRALDVARRVRAGTLWVNTYGVIAADMPFGGFGRSGLGREAGRLGYEAYTETKSVMIDTTGGQTAPLFRRK
jgi:acyl-CoA reductase-like NAD-dependent aldehyde dehydrogenase